MLHRYSLHLLLVIIISLIGAERLRAQFTIWEIAINRSDGAIVTSMQINSSGRIFICPLGYVECSDDMGATWKECNSGILASQVMSLAKGKDDEIFALTAEGIYNTIDNGATWSKFAPEVSSAFQLFVARNGDIYVATGGPGAMISTDHGATWRTELKGVIPGSFAEDQEGRIYAGLLDSGVYRTSDRGATWSPTPLTDAYVDAITATRSGTVLAGIALLEGRGRVYRTNDGGSSWSSTPLQDRVIGLLSLPDGSVVSNTASNGVVRSIDDGLTWQGMSGGLFDTRIFAMAYHPSGKLFACDPFGRIYRTITSVASADDEESEMMKVRFAPNPLSSQGAFSFSLASEDHVRLTLTDARGAQIRTLVDERLRAGDHRITLDAKELPAGVYFYHLARGSAAAHGSFVILY